MDTVKMCLQQCCGQWNIPNTLTLSRVVLGLTIFLWWEAGVEVKLLVLAYAGISDGLDGWLARLQGKLTPLGAIFDPLADKIFTNIFLLALASTLGGSAVWTLLVVNFLYDVDNTYQRRKDIANAFAGKNTVSSRPVTQLSKWKTACLFIFMFLAVLLEWFTQIPVDSFAYTCLVLVIWSWGTSRQNLIQVLFKNK